MLIASRTHDFGRKPIKEVAPLLKRNKIDAAQIVLPKGFCEIASYEQVTPEILETIRKSFEENKVKIHILGCYMDFGNPDIMVREYAVKNFKKHIAYSRILGANLVGTETAHSRLTDEEKASCYPYMMDSLARIVEEAERVGVDIAVEPVFSHPLHDLETTIKVFKELNSDRLKMIFDPVNVLELPNLDQNAYWRQWLNALGGEIEALHMKDYVQGSNNEQIPVELGEGVMNYTEIVNWSKAYKPDLVVVREELNPISAQKDINYMEKLWSN